MQKQGFKKAGKIPQKRPYNRGKMQQNTAKKKMAKNRKKKRRIRKKTKENI